MPEPSRALSWGLLGAGFAGLAAWSWGRWTDPLIDFGFELYVPWRLYEGEVLYRDIAYRNGPLSAYWNALLFTTFGVSVRTLVAANLAILAAITALLFGLLERSLSRFGALVGCAAFLAICGFSQYATVGNYNFVTPYQHGQTHGLLLGLALVWLLSGSAPGRGNARWIAAGGVLGLLLLTKAEMWIPAAAAAGCAAVLELRQAGRPALGRLTALGAAALAPPLLAWGLLARAMPAGAALLAVLGNTPYLHRALLEDPFYRHTAGLDAPGENLLALAAACAALGAGALVLWACDRRTSPAARGWAAGLAAAIGIGLGAALPLPLDALARALPVAMGLAIVRWLPGALRSDPRARTGLLLGVFALALLAKLGLAPQVQHYGFALAAPALALAVAGAVAPWRTALAQGLAVGAVAACAGSLLATSHAIYRHKDFPLAAGGDQILVAGPATSPRGVSVERLLRGLDALMPPDSTLLVLPEGAGINYWLRRDNPTPYSLFLPTEQAAHGGGEAMLGRMQASPPDFVVLVHRGHQEFGTGPFLSDPRYGAAFRGWLEQDYTLVDRIGAEPFRGPAFGIVILRRTLAP